MKYGNLYNFMDVIVDVIASDSSDKLLLSIYKLWSRISGDMFLYSDPVCVKFVGNKKITLIVKVLSSASTIFSCSKNYIAEQIKVLFDIDDVSVIPRHVSFIEKCRISQQLSPESKDINLNDNDIRSERLRSAVSKLYSAMGKRNV